MILNVPEEGIDVLVVDDEVRVVDALTFALEGSGVGLRAAATEQEMWAAVETRTPALILLDMQLADASGLDACRHLRADPRTARLPVIVLSGFNDVAVKQSAFEAGADDYVTKPFSPDELMVRIRAQLARRTAR